MSKRLQKKRQQHNERNIIANHIRATVAPFLSQYGTQTNTKHNYYYDFGYPPEPTFDQLYQMYDRNGIAYAGVTHAVEKVWNTDPKLLDGTTEPHGPTKREIALQELDDRVDLWKRMAQADEYSRVGKYAGLILRLADGKKNIEPVNGTVPGGVEGVVEIIPAFEGQLRVSEYDWDQNSPTYGKPKMYLYQESAVDNSRGSEGRNRSFEVHPDRVVIWSKDGSVNGRSVLRAGYNDLVNIEKVNGAGGEGFWKNAKAAPILNVDKDQQIQKLATMLNTTVEGIGDAMDDIVSGFVTGFDKYLMLQGITTDTLDVNLPQPAEFLAGPLQSFAASIGEPLKILIGNQTGERASTEDEKTWNSICMARRNNVVIPNIWRTLDRLMRFGILPRANWVLDWEDLTEDSMDEKIARAEKMANINKALMGTGEVAFTGDEIREVIGFEPINGSLPGDV